MVGCVGEGVLDGLSSLVEVAPAFVVHRYDGTRAKQSAQFDGSRAVMV
jgi:hypothetical protein